MWKRTLSWIQWRGWRLNQDLRVKRKRKKKKKNYWIGTKNDNNVCMERIDRDVWSTHFGKFLTVKHVRCTWYRLYLKNLLSFTNVINLLTSDWRLHWIWSTGYQSNVSAAYETRVFLGRFQRISVPVTGIQYEIHSAQGQGWSRCSRRLVFRKLS